MSEWFVLPLVPPELPRQLTNVGSTNSVVASVSPHPMRSSQKQWTTLSPMRSMEPSGGGKNVDPWDCLRSPRSEVRPSSTPQGRSGGSPQAGRKGQK